MSRPPRPHFRVSPAGDQPGRADRLDYLPLEHADFVDLAVAVARDEAGMALPGGEDREATGDVARTLLELPALLAHLLATYQDAYAAEAWLPTARTPRSLVRHARRLAYEPDGGLAATGHTELVLRDGLEGRIPKGFALASAPEGERKAQTFETLADLDVAARWNAMLPAEARVATTFPDTDGRILVPLAGTGYGLAVGGIAMMRRPSMLAAFRIAAVSEDELADETLVTLESLAATPPVLPAADEDADAWHLLVEPQTEERIFGWNADPVLFPPANVASATAYTPPSTSLSVGALRYGYRVASDGAGLGAELYLGAALDDALVDQPVALVTGDGAAACTVAAEATASVAFMRGEVVASASVSYADDGTPTVTATKIVVETSVSATVTALRLREAGTLLSWTTYPVRGRLLGRWRRALPVVATRPSTLPATQPLELAADLSGMRPGRALAVTDLAGERARIVTLTRFEASGDGRTAVEFQPDLPAAEGWTLGDLRVLGNVARISHGDSVEEVLGGSDGVSPFQRFEVKKAPVTILPGASGGDMALEVRVDGVLWRRVADFRSAGPDERVYRIERAPDGTVSVLFGGEGHGAVPPAGRRNLTAAYRVGLGSDGNVGAGRVARMKKASPLLDRVRNPLPLGGGAPPAGPEDVRTQATRHIRTFDRAVSVQDHADLALLFPGVARAAARWRDGLGIELVVATAEGVPPEAVDAVRAFMAERRDNAVPLVVRGPQAVDVALSLVVEHDPAWLPEAVRIAVQDALFGEDPPGLFAFARRGFGAAVPLSAVYAAADGAAGVATVRVVRFEVAPGSGVRDVVLATARQWLRLLPERCDVAVVPASEDDVAAAAGGTA